MKIEQLLNPDLNLDLEGRLLYLQKESIPGTVPPGKTNLKYDAVYFGAGSSPKSFSGHLNGGLEDEEVIEYVRRNNQVLYDRLWGLQRNQNVEPVTSAIIDHYDHSNGAAGGSQRNGFPSRGDSKMANAAGALDNSRAHRSASIALPKSPSSMTSLDSCGGDGLPALASRSKNELQQDLYLLQQRRYIQSLLLNEHVLILQKVAPPEAKARSRSCDHPLCRDRYGIPPGAYRLSLESWRALEKSTATTDKYYSPKGEDGGKYLKVRSTNSRGFYCLTCVEDLFNGVGMLDDDYAISASTPQVSSTPASLTSAPISIDGSSDENLEVRTIILEAAEKLLPCVRLANETRLRVNVELATDLAKQPTSDTLVAMSTKYDLGGMVANRIPSNSDDVILLRDAKRQETRATLHMLYQVAYRQEARQLSQSFSDDDLPSLKLQRPIDAPALQERYKKQGLRERDWRLWRSSLLGQRLQGYNVASVNINMNEDDRERLAPAERLCYCRELDGLEGIVSCSANFCLIGRVHLKCSGLPRLPIKDETWFCKECSAIFGPGTFNPALVITPEHDVEHGRVLRSNARALSRFVDQYEPGNMASEELSTDETSPPLSDDETLDPTYTLPMTPRRQSKSAFETNLTPYQFLDGAVDGKSKVRGPVSTEETVTSGTSIKATPTLVKDEPNGDKRNVTRTKRASTLTLQDAIEPRTPAKRLKRTSSPPPPLTPPSRHIKTSFGHLAHFIYAESRNSAAALSNPQIVALEKWKSVHLYSPLIEIMESSKSQSLTSTSPSKNNQPVSAASTPGPNIATLELGGTVIDIPSVHGKTLSQVLSKVDAMVENELRKHSSTGWEQGVHAREEAVKIGKAKGSQVDEQNGLTSPKAANEVRRRLTRALSGSKEAN